MKRLLILFVLQLLLISCSTEKKQSTATSKTLSLEETIDSLGGNSKAIDKQTTELTDAEKQEGSKNVLIPSPAELFNALNKLSKVSWTGRAAYSENGNYPADYKRALNLGVRVADGFVAIYDENRENFVKMAEVIDYLAKELNIRDSLLQKREILEEYASKGQWVELRQELDGLRTGVIKEIESLGQPDVATLAITGGWLEGLRVVSQVLHENYDEKASSILYQPQLVEHLISRFENLTADTKAKTEIIIILEKLLIIKQLCNVGMGNPISKNNISVLHAISAEIIKTIEKKG